MHTELERVIEDFDLSLIMPFYKKTEIFRKTLLRNCKFFQRKGIEVIICMDEPSEKKALLELIGSYPLINWKVIVNNKEHEWRNPSKALNVGIRYATRKYLLFIDPESEFFSDVILQLRSMSICYEYSFFIGQVGFADTAFDMEHSSLSGLDIIDYGSMLVEKKYMLAIQGYNEAISEWGGDDTEIRTRLEFYGLRRIFVPAATLIHFDVVKGHNSRGEKAGKLPLAFRSSVYYPRHYLVNKGNWGNDFSDVVYDHNAATH
jgi:glycosyltransferase involved in cell wall biosynthesis